PPPAKTQTEVDSSSSPAAETAAKPSDNARVTRIPPGTYDLQPYLDEAKEGDILLLEAGTHTLTKPAMLKTNGVSLMGEGLGNTVIKASFGGNDNAILTIKGQTPGEVSKREFKGTLASNPTAGSTIIHASEGMKIKAGDTISLRQNNDEAFLDSIGSRKWNKTSPQLRQTMARVLWVDGDRIKLDRTLGVDFGHGAELRVIDAVKDVTIKDMSIVYDIGGTPDPALYKNANTKHAVNGISVIGAVNPAIENVSVKNAGKNPLNLDTVLAPKVKNITLDGSWNKGEDGNGYFQIARTYGGLFEDVTVKNLRHITFQWSSHDNLIRRLKSDTDVNFHGGYAHHNLVEDADIDIRKGHKWKNVTRTANDAHWAPPDGKGNVVLDENGKRLG
ncbi:MAG: hypothetical protein J0L97_07570, partial [Alphaproteobacteria bacterium]|nr:hypothetical protein [Alphaproteobacteria bacterium]